MSLSDEAIKYPLLLNALELRGERVLQALVPDARILVGHGQMARDDLEEVMHAFVDGQAD